MNDILVQVSRKSGCSALSRYFVVGLRVNGKGSDEHVSCDVSWKWLCSVLASGVDNLQVCLKIICDLSLAASLNNEKSKVYSIFSTVV